MTEQNRVPKPPPPVSDPMVRQASDLQRDLKTRGCPVCDYIAQQTFDHKYERLQRDQITMDERDAYWRMVVHLAGSRKVCSP